jgi:hypothetical protein
MPPYRWIGNRITAFIENLVLGTRFTEMHSGFKAYSRRFLEAMPYQEFSDRFVFDSQMLVTAVTCGRFRIREVPIPTRYATDSSSASIYQSLKYVLQTIVCLIVIWRRRAALKEQIAARLEEIDTAS